MALSAVSITSPADGARTDEALVTPSHRPAGASVAGAHITPALLPARTALGNSAAPSSLLLAGMLPPLQEAGR